MLRFKAPDVQIHMHALLDGSPKKNEDRDAGVELVRRLSVDAKRQVKVIACGGDGTVMWVASILIAAGCNMVNVAIGVMPFGTGNDLARVLGYGGTAPSPLLGNGLSAFRRMADVYSKTATKKFDVWSVKLTMRPGGVINVVKRPAGGGWERQALDKLVLRPDDEHLISYDTYKLR